MPRGFLGRAHRRKIAKNVVDAAKRRYTTKKGLNISQIASDVALVKSMVNAEKKRFQTTLAGQLVSQVSGNNNGYFAVDLTPQVAQGTGLGQRTGSSIKLHASHFSMQFYHQPNTAGPMKLCMYLIHPKVPQTSVSTFINSIFNANPFVLNAGTPAIVDYNSDFNPDYKGQYTILRKKTFTVPMDTYSGVSVIKTIKFGHKWAKNHHVRYTADGNTVIATGQVLLLILADSGNQSSGTASTLTNVPVAGTLTGMTYDANIYHYFYDN